MVLKLDNVEIPEPSGFQIQPVNIERRHNTANGTLVIDLIRRKSIFQLTYDYMTAAEVAILLAAYATSTFKVFEYPEQGVQVQKNVWINELPRSLAMIDPEEWEGVNITMEEQ